MLVKYDLKGYDDQAALPDKQQTLMDASVEDVYGEIVLNFKKFVNDIIVYGTHKSIYAFAYTVDEGHG